MNLWDQILARIETKVNRHSFYTWFKPTSFISEDGTSISVRVPNGLFKEWLTKHYSGVIAESLSEVKRPQLSVNFIADATGDPAAVPLSPEEAAVLQVATPARPTFPAPTICNALTADVAQGLPATCIPRQESQ